MLDVTVERAFLRLSVGESGLNYATQKRNDTIMMSMTPCRRAFTESQSFRIHGWTVCDHILNLIQ